MPERRLYRSRTNRMIAGVCGGIAAYVGIAPTLVQIITVLLALPSGGPPIGLLYLVLWVVVPEEPVGS